MPEFIQQPSVVIERHSNGNVTYSARCESWRYDYHRIGHSHDEAKVKKLMKGFLKHFRTQSDDIVNGKCKPYWIMEAEVQHGNFRPVRKIVSTGNAY